jgi:hypothetical protein
MNIAELVRSDLDIKDKHDYFCLSEESGWGVVNSQQLKNELELDVMSLRLATGLIGELNCPAGNRGPKGANEVIIGISKAGIKALLELGGLPCTVCKSGRRLVKMDDGIKEALSQNTEGLSSIEDREWLEAHYDARRLKWDRILPLHISPSRFYTRPNLNKQEVNKIVELFRSMGSSVPNVGFYNPAAPGHFTQYKL